MRKLFLSLALAALITLPAHFGYAEIDETLVLYLTFNEGEGEEAKDLSQYGNHGELIGDVDWVEGKFGKAIEVLGNGENAVVVPHTDSLVIEGEITMMAWLNPTGLHIEHNQWLDKACHNGGENNGYAMWINQDGSIGGRVGSDQGRQTFMAAEKPVELGEWQHVAFTYDGNAWAIYLNSELVKKEDKGFKLEGTNEFDISIGCPQQQETARSLYYFNGAIDEVAVFNRALDEAEIKRFMNNPPSAVVSAKGKLATTWASTKAQ